MLEKVEEKKEVKTLHNELFKERFQFLLWINENIICQRYFRIIGFNPDSIGSEQFLETMNYVTWKIQNDLVSKSRVYMWCTRNEPIKLTGFVNDLADYAEIDQFIITNSKYDGNIQLSDGTTVEKEHIMYELDENRENADAANVVEPFDSTFKFQMLIDGNVVYERIWDGTVYPKYVRNSVDLTNNTSYYSRSQDKEQQLSVFALYLMQHMQSGKTDLVKVIVNEIVRCTTYENSDEYDSCVDYGDRTYCLNLHNRQYEAAARKATKQKTIAYLAELDKSERFRQSFGLTHGQLDYIDKYL